MAAIALAGSVVAGEHGRWRGPEGTGVVQDPLWDPSSVNRNPSVLWTFDVGVGYSSVGVSGGFVYASGNSDGKDTVFCLDAKTGQTRWTHSYPGKGGKMGGPRATPVIDRGFAYAVSQAGEVLCLDVAAGGVKWKVDLGRDLGAKAPQWGHSGSVLVEGDVVYLNANRWGAALDRQNGKVVWSSPEGVCGYSTPVPVVAGGKRTIVLFGQEHVAGVEMATGSKLWEFEWKTSWDVNAADPVMVGEMVLISSGYRRGCALLSVGTDKVETVWENKALSSHFATPVVIEGHAYGIDGNAGKKSRLVCLDLSNGKVKWSQETAFGSVIAANGHLVVLDENGVILIAVADSAAYREIGRSGSMLKKTCWTVPVLCDGILYCRNDSGTLAAVDMRK